MKNKLIAAAIALSLFAAPVVASASTLTSDQVNAIIGLLQAFNVDQNTINIVYADIAATSTPVVSDATSTPAPSNDPVIQAVAQTFSPEISGIPEQDPVQVDSPAPITPTCTMAVSSSPSDGDTLLNYTDTNASDISVNWYNQTYNITADRNENLKLWNNTLRPDHNGGGYNLSLWPYSQNEGTTTIIMTFTSLSGDTAQCSVVINQ